MKALRKLLTLVLVVGVLSSFDAPQNHLKTGSSNETVIKKSISSFQINKTTFYRVQVKIHGAHAIKGIAKYEELIPAGYTVKGIFSGCGEANFDSEKAEVTFISLNGRDNVTITYYMQGELPIAPKGEAKFQFVKGDDIASIEVETVK